VSNKFILFPSSFFFGILHLLEVGKVLFAKYSCTKSLVPICPATTLNSTSASWHGEPSCMLHSGLVMPKLNFKGLITILKLLSSLLASFDIKPLACPASRPFCAVSNHRGLRIFSICNYSIRSSCADHRLWPLSDNEVHVRDKTLRHWQFFHGFGEPICKC
jgi:hypothetical protein